MWDIFLRIWYFIIILPILIFQEGNQMLINYFKKKNIYWDVWRSLLLLLIILLFILYLTGYL